MRISRYSDDQIAEYKRKGYWKDKLLSDFWDHNALRYPDHEAVADSRSRLTWSQANQWINRAALGLIDLGLNRDDLVVLQLPNCVELLLLRVACEKAGLLCLPILPTYREGDLERIIRYTEPKAFIIPWRFKNFDFYQMVKELQRKLGLPRRIIIQGDEIPENAISLNSFSRSPIETKFPPDFLDSRKCRPNEFSLINMTSGSTGEPKFVEQPIYSRVHAGEEFGPVRGDTLAILSPAPGGPNLGAYFGAPQFAAKVVMLESFEAGAALQLMEREKVTYASVVPAQLSMMANHPDVDKYKLNLRVILSTGAPLPYAVGLLGEEKLKAPVCQIYGSMDSGGIATTRPVDSQQTRLLTVGRPYVGIEVKLIDDNGNNVTRTGIGEIFSRGPHAVSGYYRDPQTTAWLFDMEGWCRLGDLGKFDEMGNLVIVGRKKDIIIRGGQNIFPAEVENYLLSNPKVANAAVVTMPDPVMGEKACAYVVLKPGQTIDFGEMVAFLKGKKIAAYKLPERLELAESLPTVAAGQKIDKKALQKDLLDKLRLEGKT